MTKIAVNTPISLKEKITSTAESIIRERLNVLAAVLASAGASTDQQHLLLDRLIIAVADAEIVPQVEDSNGNPTICTVLYKDEKHTVLFNETMLLAVGDITEGILIDALAKPISKILGLPAATVAIILHERDEERLRELSVKLSGTVEQEIINYTSLKTVQAFMLKRFFFRIQKVSEILSGGVDVASITEETPGVTELLEKIEDFSRWPTWETIRGDETTSQGQAHLKPLNQVVQHTCLALSQTPWIQHAMKIIKIVWNCSDLAQRSFLVEAGRRLRSEGVESPSNVLMAIAEAVGSDSKDFSLRLQDWPRFCELQSAMDRLYLEESALFGAACEDRTHKKPVSVVDVSEHAFGTCEPEELPWNMPILCWTPREVDALRDLFLGKIKLTHGMAARASCRKTYDFSWHNSGQSELITDNLEHFPFIRVLPIGSYDVDGIADAHSASDASSDFLSKDDGIPGSKTIIERCWKAAFKSLKDNFFMLHATERETAVASMVEFYDKLNSHMTDAWSRRFEPVLKGSKKRAFAALAREVAAVTGKPCLIDPFESVESHHLREQPRLVLVASIAKQQNVSVVWLPISFLAVTDEIGSITIRLIEEREFPAESESEPPKYAWLRDIPIHIELFSKHPKDALLKCVYGDSLQVVVQKKESE